MRNRTYIAILLDASGSMASIRTPAINALNSMLDQIRQQSKLTKQETVVGVFSFSNYVQTLIPPTDINSIGRVSPDKYRCDGMTALFDAVGDGIDKLEKVRGHTEFSSSFLVMAITDGEENQSRRYSADSLKKLMRTYELTDHWTFTFQVPRGTSSRFINQFGISSDNVREWEATSEGAWEMAVSSNEGFGNYFSARAAGQTSTKAFFTPVTTDLSNVKIKDLQQLADITNEFKCHEVKSQAEIKEFIESKTKRPYVLGSAYYLLMKKERVQPSKEILILVKNTGEIFGGSHARTLIGLADGEYSRVTPGNHSNYDIFVQSKSTNRILPRGTKILMRKAALND